MRNSQRWIVRSLLLVALAAGCSSEPGAPVDGASSKPPAEKIDDDPPASEVDVQPGEEPTAAVQTEPAEKELFAGWPQPQVTLVISGNQHGYLEPCGCTG